MSVPVCVSTRRVTTCVRLRRRESNSTVPVTGSKIIESPGFAASMSSEPSTMRTLSTGRPPSSGFCQAIWPFSMSTPTSAPSVETRRAPAGVTCCQRMSPLNRTVQAGTVPIGAVAVACARSVGTRTASGSRTMGPPEGGHISPHGGPLRKRRTPSCSWERQHNADLRLPVGGFRRHAEAVGKLEKGAIGDPPLRRRDEYPFIHGAALAALDRQEQPPLGRHLSQVLHRCFAEVPVFVPVIPLDRGFERHRAELEAANQADLAFEIRPAIADELLPLVCRGDEFQRSEYLRSPALFAGEAQARLRRKIGKARFLDGCGCSGGVEGRPLESGAHIRALELEREPIVDAVREEDLSFATAEPGVEVDLRSVSPVQRIVFEIVVPGEPNRRQHQPLPRLDVGPEHRCAHTASPVSEVRWQLRDLCRRSRRDDGADQSRAQSDAHENDSLLVGMLSEEQPWGAFVTGVSAGTGRRWCAASLSGCAPARIRTSTRRAHNPVTRRRARCPESGFARPVSGGPECPHVRPESMWSR